jgi:hypothetical protein
MHAADALMPKVKRAFSADAWGNTETPGAMPEACIERRACDAKHSISRLLPRETAK